MQPTPLRLAPTLHRCWIPCSKCCVTQWDKKNLVCKNAIQSREFSAQDPTNKSKKWSPNILNQDQKYSRLQDQACLRLIQKLYESPREEIQEHQPPSHLETAVLIKPLEPEILKSATPRAITSKSSLQAPPPNQCNRKHTHTHPKHELKLPKSQDHNNHSCKVHSLQTSTQHSKLLFMLSSSPSLFLFCSYTREAANDENSVGAWGMDQNRAVISTAYKHPHRILSSSKCFFLFLFLFRSSGRDATTDENLVPLREWIRIAAVLSTACKLQHTILSSSGDSWILAHLPLPLPLLSSSGWGGWKQRRCEVSSMDPID